MKIGFSSSRVVFNDKIQPGTIIADSDTGKILKILADQNQPTDVSLTSFGNLVLAPGLVDTHVHVNEPGRTEWEGFETATQAAAAGGITTIVDMPLNCLPVTTSVSALRLKREEVEKKLWVDTGFYGGLIPGNAGQILPLVEEGVIGFKCFLIDSGIPEFPNVTENDLIHAMPILAKAGVPLLVHAELDSPVSENYSDNHSYSQFLSSRPEKWELDAIALMISLVKKFGTHVHIVHLSSGSALEFLRKAQSDGLPVTAETCPHYLTISSEDIPDGDARYKCAPPIRHVENQRKLWDGLKEGTIDFIVSDHSPCTPKLKMLEEKNLKEAWGGISSLQFGLSLMWTEFEKRGLSEVELFRWMSTNPAACFSLKNKGKLAPGYDADIVVFDPEDELTVTKEAILHKHKETPYEGFKLKGRVKHTFLRAKEVFSEESGFTDLPFGKIIKRQESSDV